MKSAIFSTVLLAAVASAVPTKRDAPTDVQILNYALTLEHLENNFYSGAVAKYDAAAFKAAGFPTWVRDRFVQISEHEASHVALLSSALGSSATKPCTYKYPYTDPKSFVALSSVLEGVGVSAYLGAAGFITNKAYLTVAGSILTTEARHQAWVSSAAGKAQPWSSAYDTPLGLNQVYSLAAPFITGCPSTNPPLPVKAFPTLTTSGAVTPGAKATFVFESNATSLFAVFYYGLTTTAVALDSSKGAVVPGNLQGTFYTVISNSMNVTDETTLAGPLISVINFPSTAKN